MSPVSVYPLILLYTLTLPCTYAFRWLSWGLLTSVIALKLLLILLVPGPFRETFRGRQFGTTYHLLEVNVADSEDVRLPSIFLECSENLSCCHIRNAVLSEGGIATSSFKRFSTLTTVSKVRGEERITMAVSSTGPAADSAASGGTTSGLGSGLWVALRDFVPSLIVGGEEP